MSNIYNKYVDPKSSQNIPRTTKWRRKIKREREKHNLRQEEINQMDAFNYMSSENSDSDKSNISDASEFSNFIYENTHSDNIIDVLSLVFGCQDEYESDEVSADAGYVTDHINRVDFSDLDSDMYTSDESEEEEEPMEYDEATSLEEQNRQHLARIERLENENKKLMAKLKKNKKDKKYLETKLCDCSAVNKGEALLMISLLAFRHDWTWSAIVDVIKFVNKLYKKKNTLKISKYKLLNFVMKKHAESHTIYVYCNECKKNLGKKSTFEENSENSVTCKCGNIIPDLGKAPYFIMLNVEDQIKDLFENSNIQPYLQYAKNRQKINEDCIEDILDGEIYKKLCQIGKILSKKWNFSYTFNTDGCYTFNSSKTTVWPIYIQLNELPPELRHKYMILVGVWASDEKPVMNEFLSPFVENMNKLYCDGINWKLNDEVINSKFVAVCGCMDCPTRCCALCMKQYNGKYGCTFCYHEGESINDVYKFPIYKSVPQLRTSSEIKKDMIIVETNNLKEKLGVLGASALMNLEEFDLAWGVTPEPMHTVFLGVTKQLTAKFLSDAGTPYYIGSPDKIRMIDERLLSIRPPKKVTRRPRSIKNYKLWKASEWCSWLMSYSLICLQDILPQRYLEHLALLVGAIKILFQDSISKEDLGKADYLIVHFVVYYQEYYGKSAMNYVIHLLLHLVNSVKKLGPLWAHNAFSFESENRIIIRMRKSARQLCKQICTRYQFYKSLPTFSKKITISDNFYEFLEDFENNIKNCFHYNNHVLIGSGRKVAITNEESKYLEFTGECLSFDKMIYKKCRYTTKNYSQQKKCDDSIIKFNDNSYGIITKIYCKSNDYDKDTFLICHPISLTGKILIINEIDHIKECEIDLTNIIVKKTIDIKKQCYIISKDYENYISELPRGCFGD